jgi:hypothetical protein
VSRSEPSPRRLLDRLRQGARQQSEEEAMACGDTGTASEGNSYPSSAEILNC